MNRHERTRTSARVPPRRLGRLPVWSLLLAAACAGDEEAAPAVDTATGELAAATPWAEGTPAEAGLDTARLRALVEAVEGGTLSNLHSVVVVRGDRIVFEAYFEGTDERRGDPIGTVRFDRTMLHDMRSVTKSITATLIGLAQDRGLLNVDDPVADYLPADAPAPPADLTIRHLLTMTSGFAWDERSYPYTDPRNSETAMDLAESSVGFVLTRPRSAPPGARFEYCGGCTMLLAVIVREATGQHLDAFAEESLFGPLGIHEYEWLRHSDGLPVAASGLRLRPRDLARIGALYESGGLWRGRQVLSSAWIDEATSVQIQLDSLSGYGYQWWVDIERLAGVPTLFPVARGNGGQRLYVVPGLDLVAVVTAGNYNSADSRFSEIAFWGYVLPAVAGADAPPPRSDGA